MAEIFGRYELLRRLATGGMGEVFLARVASGPGPLVVLKRVLPHLVGEAEVQFLEEARIAAQLSHPNLIKVLELDSVAGRWFMVMEYVDGVDVRAWRALQVPLGVALQVGLDVAAALHHAHRAKDAEGRALQVVHCDVSPHNLLVGRDGTTRLIDFGTARARLRGAAPPSVAGQGKYAYLSPEQALGEDFDQRSDQFSLGVVLWELVTGARLFEGEGDVETLKRLEACEVPAPSLVRPGIPGVVDSVLAQMLAREPTRRFPDCGAVEAALVNAHSALPALVSRAEVAGFVARVAPVAVVLPEGPAALPTAAPQDWESARRRLLERAPGLPQESTAALSERLRPTPRALEFLAGVGERLRPELCAQVKDLPSALGVVWGLLTGPERDAVSQLSVFGAPFTVEEAEAAVVLEAGAPPVLDVLEVLVSAGLVSQRGHTSAGSPRFAVEGEVKAFVAAVGAAVIR